MGTMEILQVIPAKGLHIQVVVRGVYHHKDMFAWALVRLAPDETDVGFAHEAIVPTLLQDGRLDPMVDDAYTTEVLSVYAEDTDDWARSEAVEAAKKRTRAAAEDEAGV